MGSVSPELSLDSRPSAFIPKRISDFLDDVLMIQNTSERASKFDDYLKRLEEEMRKIDAFKRELPLCNLLLKDAIIALKAELIKRTVSNNQSVLEEFIPLEKKDGNENEEKEKDREKKNWMRSVQLWNTDINYPKTEIKRKEEETGLETEDLLASYKNKTGARAFMPIKAYPPFPKDDFHIHNRPLLSPGNGTKDPREESASSVLRLNGNRSESNLRAGLQQQVSSRKQRRCWSPELHRRFVNALQQLGGSQAATPKQIRELMQVDGLTNDEVKSHLQKYRLHTRRVPAGDKVRAEVEQSGFVLGSGLWMTRDQCNESSSKAGSSQSISPQGPLHLTRAEGESMEDDEDAKSESFSWKSHVHKHGKDDV